MIGFYTLVLAIGIAFSSFLITSYQGISSFEKKTSELINYDTTALASATRVAKESSQFLTDLQATVILSEAKDPSSYQKTPTELLEELILDLQAHSENQLSRTIAYGLEGKQDYKLELLHSNYLPTQLKKTDKRYASTILEGELKAKTDIYPAAHLDYYITNDKLRVSPRLVSALATNSATEAAIIYRQAELGLEVSDDGLRLEDLPNSVRLQLNKDEILRPKKESLTIQADKYISKTAVAQLRIGKVITECIPGVNCPCTSFNEKGICCTPGLDCTCQERGDCPCTSFDEKGNCCIPGINCSCEDRGDCWQPDPAGRLELAISVMPFSQRGFVYDALKPIDSNNPLQVINKKEGGYSSVFVRDDGYLQISIGSITTKLSNNNLVDYFATAEMSVDPVTLSFTQNKNNPGVILSGSSVMKNGSNTILSEPDLTKLTIVETKKIEIDIVPRGRTAYTVVDNEFIVKGMTIPKGSIIVASKKAGNFERDSELSDYESFRVYDSKTGNFISSFGNNALGDLTCSNGVTKSCVDIKKFLQTPGTSNEGQDILYSFSLAELMPGVAPLTATENWAKIQTDLALDTQSDLNAKTTDWLADELKKLNKQELLYTGVPRIDTLTDNDYEQLSRFLELGDRAAFRSYLGLDNDPAPTLDPNYFNTYEREQLNLKWQARTDSLAVYAEAKLGLWNLRNKTNQSGQLVIEDKIDNLIVKRNTYISSLDSYNADKKLYSAIDQLDPAQVTAQKIKELEAKKATLKTEITNLEAQKASLNKEIKEIEARIEVLKQAINALKGNKKKKAERDQKEANLEKKKAELVQANTRLNAIKYQIVQKEAELNNVKKQINSL